MKICKRIDGKIFWLVGKYKTKEEVIKKSREVWQENFMVRVVHILDISVKDKKYKWYVYRKCPK